ncbi:Cytochrome P450 monooxygenase 208 [Psilocybe cubensis]|uniref:Cytochrome P450 monooxygenase 208 n=1 Tax=Psilocybe cubensis TaxID=181762 RepID=A0ACB8GPH1_PSICU|nr:Cytochrome P450 monooxygenase 208 [Psilocybe cubensis]KAH9477561.1 Cytochrome P450 monooxygenase 208 [Psilocybe cubensis]
MSTSAIVLLCLFPTLYFLKKLLFPAKQLAPLPPGPKGLPIIGNALDFPTKDIGQEYVRWEKLHASSILHATAFGTHVIVLNKKEAADELFERRAQKYSDRPHFPLAEMVGLSYNMAFMGYGDKWRLCRKITQQMFRQGSMENFNWVIQRKVHQALGGLLSDPNDFAYHNKMLAIAIPMASMYGYDVQSPKDPCIIAADKSLNLSIQLIAPGGSLINILPILKHVPAWFPGASSRKAAERVRKLTEDMQQIPLDFVKSQMSKGTAAPSFVAEFLERKQTVGVSEEEEAAVLSIAPTVYAGGSDTTVSTLGTFIYLMAVNPDVQKKAHAEIDSIIGTKRLPEFEDRPMMPYAEAIYREVLRWKPPSPVGIPHTAAEDDIYDGYFIPKGTTVLANIWAMTHDESVYSQPDIFRPERFFNADGTLNDDDRVLTYGFGRRQHMASNILWMAMVSILAAFNIGKARDESGNEIDITDEYVDFGFLTHKKPFKCSITPRSVTAQQLVEQACANA